MNIVDEYLMNMLMNIVDEYLMINVDEYYA